MDLREDRWYVRFRGHTLGPLTTEQVKSSLRSRELSPTDKLASVQNPAWMPLNSYPEFLKVWESFQSPTQKLVPPPSPQILWKKKKAVILPPVLVAPKISETPTAPVIPEILETVVALAPQATELPTSPLKSKKKQNHARETKAKGKESTEAKTKAPPVAVLETAPTPKLLFNEAVIPVPAPKNKQLADEALSLMEVLRDWSQREKELNKKEEEKQREKSLRLKNPEPVKVKAPTEAAPETAAIFLSEIAVPAGSTEEKKGALELRLTVSKHFIFISAAVTALALTAILFVVIQGKKMRGPDDSRLPDPSSPTTQRATPEDPIPQLRAPTRPKRD